MMNITPPPALHGDEQAKLTQVYRYLFRLSEQLNATAATIDSQAVKASEAVARAAGIDPATVSADVGEQYTSLVSLVVKTANIVQSQMDKIVTTLQSRYKAQSEFGELTEEVRRLIEETAKHTIENYQYGAEVLNIPEMAADFEAYKIEAEGYIKRGIIDYDKDGFPVFGIAIGQELKSREVTIDGVVYTEFDTTKNMATYTAEKLSFWIDGVEVAYLSQSELVVTRIIVSDSIQLGDWDIKVNAQDGLTIQQRIGNEIVTASQINMVADQIDLSGNKSIKLTAEQINAVANEIDLSGNKSIKLTAEQINAVAGQIDLTSNKSITMLAGEVDNLDRLSNIEVIEGTFAQTERREGEGIRIYSEIGPKQDLKLGAPWPGGAGKNLWNNNATALSQGATRTDTGFIFVRSASGGSYVYYRHPLKAGETVTFSAKFDNYVMDMYIYETAVYGTQLAYGKATGKITYTATADYPQATFAITIASAQGDCNVSDIQIEYGNAVTDYAPYANTPPIEGWTGLEAFAGGKNLLKNDLAQTKTNNGIDFTFNADGSVRIVHAAGYDKDTFFYLTRSLRLPVGKYTISGMADGIILRLGDADKNDAYIDQYTASQVFSVTEEKTLTVSVRVRAYANARDTVVYPMIRLASDSDAAYVPYQGNTYALGFGETVYGGKVDWHAGEMTVEWGTYTLTGEGSAKLLSASVYNAKCFMTDVIPNMMGNSDALNGAKSSHFTEGVWNSIVDMDSPFGRFAVTTSNKIGIAYDGTIAEANAWLAAQHAAGTPVQFVWKLAEPYTIQLTPVQIETLQGINTVYTDADGGRVEFGHSLLPDAVKELKGEIGEVRQTANAAVSTEEFKRVVRLDEEGLHVGDNKTSNEVLIDSDSVNVVMSGQKYSRFTADYVQFGDYQLRKSADGGLVFKL